MSRERIHAWLDGEMDEAGRADFEAWLREDPAHRREFLHAVALVEDLRSAYRQREAPPLPARPAFGELWRWFRPGVWVPAGGLAAALLVCVFVYFQTRQPPPRQPQQSASSKPAELALQRQTPAPAPAAAPPAAPARARAAAPVSKAEPPKAELARHHPAAPAPDEGGQIQNPEPKKVDSKAAYKAGEFAQYQITITGGDLAVTAQDTSDGRQIKAGDKGGSLRWGTDLDLQVNPRSSLRLVAAAAADKWIGSSRRMIQLDNGQVRVRRLTQRPARRVEPTDEAPTSTPVEVVTAAGRIVADNAEFEVGYVTTAAPIGTTTNVRVAVVSGQVRITSGPEAKTEEKTVRAGETINLPMPVKGQTPSISSP